jgi:hypothetical protein
MSPESHQKEVEGIVPTATGEAALVRLKYVFMRLPNLSTWIGEIACILSTRRRKVCWSRVLSSDLQTRGLVAHFSHACFPLRVACCGAAVFRLAAALDVFKTTIGEDQPCGSHSAETPMVHLILKVRKDRKSRQAAKVQSPRLRPAVRSQ